MHIAHFISMNRLHLLKVKQLYVIFFVFLNKLLIQSLMLTFFLNKHIKALQSEFKLYPLPIGDFSIAYYELTVLEFGEEP